MASFIGQVSGSFHGDVIYPHSLATTSRGGRHYQNGGRNRQNPGQWLLPSITNAWKGLTYTEVTSWVGAKGIHPLTSGPWSWWASIPMGFAIYNTLLFYVAGVINPIFPGNYTAYLPPVIGAGAIAPNHLYINLSSPVGADELVVVYASAPYPLGLQIQEQNMAVISTLTAGASGTVDVGSDYIGVYGFLPTNTHILVQCAFMNVNRGNPGYGYKYDVTP